MRMRGLSLIEMMAVLAIIAILLMVGVPSMSDYLQNSRLRAVSEQLSSDLKAARVEALNRNRMTTFAVSASGWSYAVPSVAAFAGYSASPAELNRSVALASNQAAICFDGTGRVLAADCGGGAGCFASVRYPAGERERSVSRKRWYCAMSARDVVGLGTGPRVQSRGCGK